MLSEEKILFCKENLLQIITAINQGLFTPEQEQEAILAAVENLEASNPNPKPLQVSELLEGDWKLLYTTSYPLLNGLNRIPGFKNGGNIYQCIRTKNGKIYNIAELNGWFNSGGLICAEACYESVSDNRLNVRFERAISGLQGLLPYSSPSNFIQEIEAGKNFFAIEFSFPSVLARIASAFVIRKSSYLLTSPDPTGWLEITYLDKDLRIGRGNFDGVYVLVKV